MISKFKFTLDGIAYDAERRPGLVILNGIEYTMEIKTGQIYIGGAPFAVKLGSGSAEVDGISYAVTTEGLEEAKTITARNRKASSVAAGASAGAVLALMPGLIIKMLKSEGDSVRAGEAVAILEAMKMQNELKAPISGTVRQVNAKEGDNVEMRQVLCVVE
jgi:pyruvate carboxylase subunit B